MKINVVIELEPEVLSKLLNHMMTAEKSPAFHMVMAAVSSLREKVEELCTPKEKGSGATATADPP
jgi:hypothetical protein